MKYFISVLLILGLLMSCQSEAEKAQAKADAMVADALANAKKIEAETLAKAAKKVREQAISAEKETKVQEKEALKHQPNKALSKYNGFYVENRNYNGALIFVDGKLVFFDCSRFKTVYKNEEYNVKGVTDDNYLDIYAKYYKNRKGELEIKSTILHQVVPTLSNGTCSNLERNGVNFPKITTFSDFIKTQRNYSLDGLLKDYKAKYNGTDVAIQKALDNPNFYKADFFQKAPFYGDRMPLADALESIIQL